MFPISVCLIYCRLDRTFVIEILIGRLLSMTLVKVENLLSATTAYRPQ